MLKHLINSIMSCHKQYPRIVKLYELWAMMSPYPSSAHFNMPYSHVTQCGGKEMNALRHVIVPVFAATHVYSSTSQRVPFTDPLLCVKNLEYYHLMAQYYYHTEATIEYLQYYLEEFHCPKDVFIGLSVSKSTRKVSEELKKQCTLVKQ